MLGSATFLGVLFVFISKSKNVACGDVVISVHASHRMCVWVYGCMGVWVYVCMCVWVYVCMCVCVYGCMGADLGGWQPAFGRLQ